jgi:hypothetical protein
MYAFIDTNTFLHYPQPDKLDWCGLLGADRVTLLVAPVVVRELEKLKDTPGSRLSRERAASAVHWLARIIGKEPREIRTGVFVRLQAHDPQINFNEFRLSEAVNDDWLIATVLEFLQNEKVQPVLLVTDDIGLRIKSEAHGISNRQLPDSLKLPQEAEPAEKRVKELEEDLRRLQDTRPRLRLQFKDGKDYFRVRLPDPPVLSGAQVREKLEMLRIKHPKLLATNFLLSVDGLAQYNSQLEEYYRAYEKYLAESALFESLKCGTVKLEMILRNSGGAPAMDIDVFMHFPDIPSLYDDEGLRKALVAPREPRAPMTPRERLATVPQLAAEAIESIAAVRPYRTARSATSAPNVGSWSIKRKNGYDVTTHVERVKHYLRVPLRPLFVVFPSSQEAKSFGVDYALIAANSPERTEGTLHVVIEADKGQNDAQENPPLELR